MHVAESLLHQNLLSVEVSGDQDPSHSRADRAQRVYNKGVCVDEGMERSPLPLALLHYTLPTLTPS